MELDVGMSRAGLRKLANEILEACNRNDAQGEGIEVVRHIEPNGPMSSLLKLTFNNDDMGDREDVGEDTAYWEMSF